MSLCAPARSRTPPPPVMAWPAAPAGVSRGTFLAGDTLGASAPRAAHRAASSVRILQRELPPVEVEMPGLVAVQVVQGHVAGEERVPRRGVVHSSPRGTILLLFQPTLKPCNHPVKLALPMREQGIIRAPRQDPA